MSDLHPLALRKAAADQLAVDWSDGHSSVFSFAHLRANCPCATCREERDQKAAAETGGAAPIGGHGHHHGHEHGHDHAHDHLGGAPTGSGAGMIALPLLPPKPEAPTLKEVNPVGRYAFSLVWSDGHATGIYAFEFLRGLCECPECRRAGR